MSKTRAVKNEIAGKTKRLAGEILGDQKLHDEGKAQEREGRQENDETGNFRPSGNPDEPT